MSHEQEYLKLCGIEDRLASIEKYLNHLVNTREWMSVREASEYTGLHRDVLTRLGREEQIVTSAPTKRRIFFLRSSINEWIENGSPSRMKLVYDKPLNTSAL